MYLAAGGPENISSRQFSNQDKLNRSLAKRSPKVAKMRGKDPIDTAMD